MVTLNKTENQREQSGNIFTTLELRGLSTDIKPTQWGVFKIENGSTFIEIDTGKLYLYDLENQEWHEV